MDKKLIKISKFLSLVLRHKPEIIKLELSANGWIKIDDFLKAAQKHGTTISRDMLDEVVYTNDKKRFAFSPDGLSIRANQGHSIDIDLELTPQVPPDLLYHGTAKQFLSSIKNEGLRKMGRQYVHLSASKSTAFRVGKRRGIPIVLTIKALKMFEDDINFYLSKNGVWLTEYVAPKYIEVV